MQGIEEILAGLRAAREKAKREADEAIAALLEAQRKREEAAAKAAKAEAEKTRKAQLSA